MARQCSVCVHRDRDSIDKALVEHDTSYRHLASRFDLSLSAVYRHARNHVPETLAKAHEIKEVAKADVVLDEINRLKTEAQVLLDYGKRKKKGREWQAGLQELRKNIELLAKVTGKLTEKVEINLFALPQFTTILTVIRETLEPFPEAKKAVAAAMKELRNANGDDS